MIATSVGMVEQLFATSIRMVELMIAASCGSTEHSPVVSPWGAEHTTAVSPWGVEQAEPMTAVLSWRPAPPAYDRLPLSEDAAALDQGSSNGTGNIQSPKMHHFSVGGDPPIACLVGGGWEDGYDYG